MHKAAMDADAFAEMKELMGDSFTDIISLTLSSLPEQLLLLEQALGQQDAEAIFNVAHRIKSSTGTIGALGLADDAQAIEAIARGGTAEIPAQLIENLRTAANDVICTLEKELNS